MRLLILLTQMDIQIKKSHQQQLNDLLSKNQHLFTKRSNQLFSKLEALMNDGGQLYFNNSVNLDAALQCFKAVVQKKKKQSAVIIDQESQIDREIINQLGVQRDKLVSQIADLQKQIQQFKQNKNKYELAQKYASKRILDNQQLIINKQLNLCKGTQQKQSQFNTLISFSYDENRNKVDFKKSYVDIIHHFFTRIEENELIITTLQKSVEQKVQQSERIKLKVKKVQETRKQVQRNNIQIEGIKRKNEKLKTMLKTRVKQINGIVSQKLPELVDQQLRKIRSEKQNYQKAYHSLLQVLNRVVSIADLDNVYDYINQP